MNVHHITGLRPSCIRSALISLTCGLLIGGYIPHVQAAEDLTGSYADMGKLRLQIGSTVVTETGTLPARFLYEGKDGESEHQFFLRDGKCGGHLDAGETAFQLATMSSGPGSFPLGFGPDSLGVQDGPKGVACYRISADVGGGEWIKFGLGDDLKSTYKARSFWKIELDMEVKKNARFELQVLRGGKAAGDPWVLESGTSITGSSDDRTFACLASSDSGPDSGPSDNCRWVIEDVGDGFILAASFGEGSLEGGGDFAEAYANNTIIYLTDAEVGVLGCDVPGTGADGSPYTSIIGDGNQTAQCAVTRVDTGEIPDSTVTCETNIPYIFRTVSTGIGGCSIEKPPAEQAAAVLNILFPREKRTELDKVGPTSIYFPDPDPSNTDGYVKFDIPLCRGTIEYDGNSQPTIKEVLDESDALGMIDQVPYTPDIIEWACVLDNEVMYLGDGVDEADMMMQVRQQILFFADPVIIRQGPDF